MSTLTDLPHAKGTRKRSGCLTIKGTRKAYDGSVGDKEAGAMGIAIKERSAIVKELHEKHARMTKRRSGTCWIRWVHGANVAQRSSGLMESRRVGEIGATQMQHVLTGARIPARAG
jgi:hypothetical protein